MGFFLTDEQEHAIDIFLDTQNRIIANKQLESDEVPAEYKDMIEKTLASGSPIPFFNPEYGYYSISFTPCDKGNRIYVHHHLTNISECIFDPAQTFIEEVDTDVEVSEVVTDMLGELDNLESASIDN
jgi:hypothetical protein